MIGLLTANVGNFDLEHLVPNQSVYFRHHYFTDNNLPFPLPNLNNRLRGKYIKANSHRFLSEEIFIWIDGSIEITSPHYVERQIELLGDADVLVCTHPSRMTAIEELEFILHQLTLGGANPHSKYLIHRYANEPIKEELQFFTDYGHDLPLYAGGIFTRVNSEKVNKAFEEWFLLCLEFANFDQCMFSYIIHKHGLKVVTQDYHSELRKFHNHLF